VSSSSAGLGLLPSDVGKKDVVFSLGFAGNRLWRPVESTLGVERESSTGRLSLETRAEELTDNPLAAASKLTITSSANCGALRLRDGKPSVKNVRLNIK
jgi:hypothetical protein